MAEEFIESIYCYSDILFELEKIVDYGRQYIDTKAIKRLDMIFPKLTKLCRECIEDDLDIGKQLWGSVKKLTTIENDLIAICDQIELEVIPALKKYICTLADIHVEINDNYSIHSTSSGYLTLFCETKKINIHSRNNPMFDAMLYVRSLYDIEKSVYYVFGCGMGYELYQLYDISESFTKIVLYEPDDTVYNLALSYGMLSRIPDKNLERREFNNADEFFMNASSDNAGILIHVPSVHALDNTVEQKKLITYWMNQNTTRQFKGIRPQNTVRNEMLNLPDAQEYIRNNLCSEAVVAAAGPSLSNSLDLLRKWKNDKKIIAVGTIFRKLLTENIIPDCVVIIDPADDMTEQLEGLEDSNVPILLDINAYWKLARMYKGPKYIMRDLNYEGTVSAAAIEVAAHLNPNMIYMTGLDLSYPVMQSHVDGAAGSWKITADTLFTVESNDNGKVLTDTHLSCYISAIERIISSYPDICFYNLSKHGAKIHGALVLDIP